MKLKDLGFRKKTQQLFSKGKTGKPAIKESPLLQEHNLPDPDQKQPGWLHAYHEAENITSQAFRDKVESMFKLVHV